MKIAIIGFGREGQSLFKYLNSRGATQIRTQSRSDAKGKPVSESPRNSPRKSAVVHSNEPHEIWILDKNEHAKIPREIPQRLGKSYLNNLSEFDLVFRSPGVPYMTPELVKARKQGIKFSTPTQLFFEEAKLRGARIIGITGTKGKGTASTLIHSILSRAGKKTFLAGNIGTPALDIVQKLNNKSWVVLELSSFQLIDLKQSPTIAVVLMVTSEHLDWHKNLPEYVRAKENILRFQSPADYSVIADEYPRSKLFARRTKGTVLTFSKRNAVQKGAWTERGVFWFSDGLRKEKICETSNLWIPGFHNLDNTCASIAVAKILRITNSIIRNAIRDFRGLEHRLELVRKIRGVAYYDDSYATTPETAIVAIQAFENPKILILGGSSKGSDFRKLGKVISDTTTIKAIIGIGVEWARIKAHIRNPRIQIIETCKTMKEIVREARAIATSSDVVLLSPACASFGMFKNYTDRGEQFKKAVRAII
jgi:UDP-N-acetylmuramoylalanine--D-glutamate ligase